MPEPPRVALAAAVAEAERRWGGLDAVLVFLAGDGASGMTGAIVPVDGGLAL